MALTLQNYVTFHHYEITGYGKIYEKVKSANIYANSPALSLHHSYFRELTA